MMILPLALILCLKIGCQYKDAMAELEEFKAQAEAMEQPTWQDIDYVGDGIVGHRLDIYLPDTNRGPFPVVVYIYGSAFFSNNSKGNVKRAFAPVLLEAGFAVVAINHRGTRVDNVVFPAPVHDVKAAVRFIRANAAAYHIDPSRIGATGCSSGGHLVAFLGTSGGVTTHTVGEATMHIEGSLGAHTDVSSSVQAVCDWFGPTDFLVMDSCGSRMNHDAPDSPESVLIGGPIQEHPDECALANPATYIDSDDPPFMIIHGDNDPLVPYCNSESFDAALDKAGVPSEYILVEGAGHGDGLIESEYLDKMVQFFENHLADD
jgi:acetyl esterase/lipase